MTAQLRRDRRLAGSQWGGAPAFMPDPQGEAFEARLRVGGIWKVLVSGAPVRFGSRLFTAPYQKSRGAQSGGDPAMPGRRRKW
jgi:hypothetical protein